jgi:hypothetical protein
MADDLPSTTPENGGQDKGSADESAHKRKKQPKKEKKPSDAKCRKDSRITLKQLFDFGGIAGVCLIWAEMIGCHEAWKLITYGVALLFLYLLLCHFLYELLRKQSWSVWLAIIVWFLLATGTSGFVWKNSRTEQAPYPHLHLAISTEDAPNDLVELTNNFMRKKNMAVGEIFKSSAVFLMPLQTGQTDFVFAVHVRNETDSPVTAKDTCLIMSFPEALQTLPGYGWQRVGNNDEQQWAYFFPDMLPGIALPTSGFVIFRPATNIALHVNFLIRATDCPSEGVAFLWVPFVTPTNFPPQKGFITEWTTTNWWNDQNIINDNRKDIIEHLHK